MRFFLIQNWSFSSAFNFPKGYAFAHDTREKLHHLDEMSKRKESLHNVSSFHRINFYLSAFYSSISLVQVYGISGYNNTYDSMMTFVLANGKRLQLNNFDNDN